MTAIGLSHLGNSNRARYSAGQGTRFGRSDSQAPSRQDVRTRDQTKQHGERE
jgi:hypothetical protein